MMTGGASPGNLPLTDVTGRMAALGRLFAAHVGVADPALVPDAVALVETIRRAIPRTTAPGEDAPAFEAAAFMGEWLRAWTDASWIAEGPGEPHLQVLDDTRSIVHLVPLVSIVRVASTAGYDGLPRFLGSILQDVLHAPVRCPIGQMRVEPPTERARVAAWVEQNRGSRDGSRATLWRRCASCSKTSEECVTLRATTDDWEHDAATAATILARRPFQCACGGAPGEVSRFLQLWCAEGEERLVDIYAGGQQTRVASWSLEGDDVVPLDTMSGGRRAP